MEVDSGFADLSRNLLNTISDCASFKARYVLQNYFCTLWSTYLKNRHIKSIFEFVNEYIILRELEHHFKKDLIFDKENYLEFKSADDVDSKPSNFTNKLVSTARDYMCEGKLTRSCILYGIEDNCKIKPVPKRRLRSDEVSKIESAVNKELARDKVKAILQPIPVGEDTILAVLLIPIIENWNSQNRIVILGEAVNEIA